jgi:hypothetical protein
MVRRGRRPAISRIEAASRRPGGNPSARSSRSCSVRTGWPARNSSAAHTRAIGTVTFTRAQTGKRREPA